MCASTPRRKDIRSNNGTTPFRNSELDTIADQLPVPVIFPLSTQPTTPLQMRLGGHSQDWSEHGEVEKHPYQCRDSKRDHPGRSSCYNNWATPVHTRPKRIANFFLFLEPKCEHTSGNSKSVHRPSARFCVSWTHGGDEGQRYEYTWVNIYASQLYNFGRFPLLNVRISFVFTH